MRPTKALLPLLALLFGSLAYAPTTAHAENEKAESAAAWGLLATEASMAGIFALNFNVKDWPSEGPAFMVNMVPMLIGPGVAWGAYAGEFNPRPAYAIQGAASLGVDLFLVGMLLDGLGEEDTAVVGMNAWALGGIGAAAGAWIGATEVDQIEEGVVFYGAPIAGFGAGGLLGMATSLISGNLNDISEYALYGATAGMTIGVAASVIVAYAGASDEAEPGASSSNLTKMPAVTGDSKKFMMSFGGSF